MGGNALQVASVRLAAARFREVERAVLDVLRVRFPGRRIGAPQSSADKPDFGDLDAEQAKAKFAAEALTQPRAA